MKKFTILLHWLVLAALLAASLAACTTPTTPAPTEALMEPTETNPPPTDAPTDAPEATATATELPTVTPTATITPLPSPTPLPPGFYANYDAGFSFTHPTAWRLDAEDASFVRFVDPSLGLVTIVVGYPAADIASGAEPETIDSVTLDLSQALFEDAPRTAGETFLVPLGDDLEAPAKDVTAQTDTGELVARIIFYTQNFRSYFFIFLSSSSSFNASESRINNLLETVNLFSPQPFGLPKDHNLILTGFDPDPEDLDPAKTTGSASGYVGLLFTGLVRLNPALAVEPDLAESWSVSEDGTQYTFKLRQGLTFADGLPITTEDVIYSWERAADPNTESPTARTYLGDILGLDDKLDGKADTIQGLQAVDDLTLVVTLDAPKPYFLAKLTYPTSFIVDETQVEGAGEDWVWEANASGAYLIKDYRETEVMVFERNPRYHTPPTIQYVTHIINPGGSWISRYEDGTLDILYLDSATTERVRREDDPLHDEWQSGASLCTTFLALNNSLPPFDDPLVRKAFALAVDRDTYIERLTNNLNLAALTLLPPGMPGFSDTLSMLYDAEAARQALEDSTYAGNLPEITLETSGFATEGSPAVNALVDMWQKTLGVEVQVSFLDPQNYTEAALKEQNQMTLYGWCADYPDPQNFLEVLFSTGSEFNVAGYSNPEFDRLVEQAGIEIDPAERIALYQQAEKLLLEDYGISPISHDVTDVLVRPRLQGYVLAPIVDYYMPWLSLQPENP
jgi:ABC-type oligopeptide transport system substrate-binding subunit